MPEVDSWYLHSAPHLSSLGVIFLKHCFMSSHGESSETLQKIAFCYHDRWQGSFVNFNMLDFCKALSLAPRFFFCEKIV